jgi:hypothetical protein
MRSVAPLLTSSASVSAPSILFSRLAVFHSRETAESHGRMPVNGVVSYRSGSGQQGRSGKRGLVEMGKSIWLCSFWKGRLVLFWPGQREDD